MASGSFAGEREKDFGQAITGAIIDNNSEKLYPPFGRVSFCKVEGGLDNPQQLMRGVEDLTVTTNAVARMCGLYMCIYSIVT